MENWKKEIEQKIVELSAIVNSNRRVVKLYAGLIICVIVLASLSLGSFKSFDVATTHHYNNGALVAKPVKMLHITATPTTGNGGVLDISSYGLTQVLNVMVTTQRNTSIANNVVNASVKSFTNTQVTYNIVQGSDALISALGLVDILQGKPKVYPASPGDITLRFIIVGY